MKDHLIKIENTNGYANSTAFTSEKEAMAYILNNGYHFLKAKESHDGKKVIDYVKKQKNDWKVIKNHHQKMKEIPGYAKEFNNYYKSTPTARKLEPAQPICDDEWDDEDTNAESLWPKDFFKFLNEEFKKNNIKKIIPSDPDSAKYYIYNKGKLAKMIKATGIHALTEWLEEHQAFIISIDKKSKSLYYVYICHSEDIARFLPDKLVIKRFEEIVNARGMNCINFDEDDYEHLEL